MTEHPSLYELIGPCGADLPALTDPDRPCFSWTVSQFLRRLLRRQPCE